MIGYVWILPFSVSGGPTSYFSGDNLANFVYVGIAMLSIVFFGLNVAFVCNLIMHRKVAVKTDGETVTFISGRKFRVSRRDVLSVKLDKNGLPPFKFWVVAITFKDGAVRKFPTFLFAELKDDVFDGVHKALV